MTFTDGSCEGRSRSEEEVMQGHRRCRPAATNVMVFLGRDTNSLLVGSSDDGGILGKFADQADNLIVGNAFFLGHLLKCVHRLPG